MAHALTLDDLQRIRCWHLAHRLDHPVEYQLWDSVLTCWVMAWVGWMPAYAFGALWALPLCALGVTAPYLYVGVRKRAHRAQRLRCDWLSTAP